MNPTRDNCRFGASRDLLFPPDRQVQLDVNYLKKMGLTRKRMLECDALFFYQLLLPIVDPAMSAINDDPRMGYYEGKKFQHVYIWKEEQRRDQRASFASY